MHKLIAVAAFLAVAVPFAGADDAAEKAAKKLDGTYTLVAGIRDGKEDPDAKGKIEAVVIKDGAITIKTGRRDEPATFKLDPSKKPAHIDLTPGKGKADTVPGIYETKESADGFELTIAIARNGKARPTDFKGEGEDGAVLKLRRKKDDK